MIKQILPVFLFLLLFSSKASSQTPGDFDTTFHCTGFTNGWVYKTVVLSDGKIIVVGDFDQFEGVVANHIVRLNPDGTIDLSFAPGAGVAADGYVRDIEVLSDDKILISGFFQNYDGNPANRLARLNSDGSFDPTFNIGAGANYSVLNFEHQSDGRLVISGEFDLFDSIPYSRVARLDANGALDQSFAQTTVADNSVNDMVIQSNDRIILVGQFSALPGAIRIARLFPDGGLDSTFYVGSGADNTVETVALQPDGKILVGGAFTTINGVSRGKIARLNSNGSLDNTLDFGTGFDGDVIDIYIQPNGKMIVGGNFTMYNNSPANYIVRLNTDGTLDPTFNPGSGPNSRVLGIGVHPGNQFLLAGEFNFYDVNQASGLARIFGGECTQTISGFIMDNSQSPSFTANDTLQVSLFQETSSDSTVWPMVDSFLIVLPNASAYFVFDSLSPGTYMLKAEFLDPVLGENYMPTYSGDSLLWNTAESIQINYCDSIPYDINIQNPYLPMGANTLSGYLYFTDSILQKTEVNSDPIPLIDVIIEKDSVPNQFRPFTATDPIRVIGFPNYLLYSFPNLPNGNYRISICLPGISQADTIYKTFDGTNPNDTVNFCVDTVDIGLIDTCYLDTLSDFPVGIFQQKTIEGFSIYPNPSPTKATLSFNSSEVKSAVLFVTDVFGVVLIKQDLQIVKGNNRIPIALDKKGLYFLNLRMADWNGSAKWMVE